MIYHIETTRNPHAYRDPERRTLVCTWPSPNRMFTPMLPDAQHVREGLRKLEPDRADDGIPPPGPACMHVRWLALSKRVVAQVARLGWG